MSEQLPGRREPLGNGEGIVPSGDLPGLRVFAWIHLILAGLCAVSFLSIFAWLISDPRAIGRHNLDNRILIGSLVLPMILGGSAIRIATRLLQGLRFAGWLAVGWSAFIAAGAEGYLAWLLVLSHNPPDYLPLMFTGMPLLALTCLAFVIEGGFILPALSQKRSIQVVYWMSMVVAFMAGIMLTRSFSG